MLVPVEAEALAEAIGVLVVCKLAHGEGAGAYEVRMADGTPAVLKVDADDVLDFGHSIRFTEALRVRGLPRAGEPRVGRRSTGRRTSSPSGCPAIRSSRSTEAHIPQLVALVDKQRDVGPAGPRTVDRRHGREPDRRLRGVLRARVRYESTIRRCSTGSRRSRTRSRGLRRREPRRRALRLLAVQRPRRR